MTQEPRPRGEESNVEADERRRQEPDAASEASPPSREIIPGNVGSLDDVPPDWVEEGDVVDEEEA